VLFIEELLDSYLIGKVKFLMRTAYQIGVASLEQIIPNSGTH
jgi:hypothetical protein